MKRLHRALRRWRVLHELTQADVAQRLSISRPYVAAIERGYVPPLSLIEKISALTGVASAELIMDETDAAIAEAPTDILGPRPSEPATDPEALAYTPVRQKLTTKGAIERAKRVLSAAGLSEDQTPPNLLEFLCRREASYLKVTPEEVTIMLTLRFKKGDTGDPEPDDYLDFLVTTLRPFIPKEP